ncbi:hypothetical protein GPAL_2585 [Glaciecola pallidula DSM 14239 = ACAM 615]|uniref:Uncharacterized protein n=1 Tax=Brumicola pallidula DSM 14239 = ACAM 615 TaxID=1121922 RepID=K7A1P7_9ALTE|nr:hypothetical protein GPAL_2585 [Glaciecola pallidula DSM 14239 = ACAM 615]
MQKKDSETLSFACKHTYEVIFMDIIVLLDVLIEHWAMK